jgi:hypothetical protein
MIGYLMTFFLFLVGFLASGFIAAMQWVTGTEPQPAIR